MVLIRLVRVDIVPHSTKSVDQLPKSIVVRVELKELFVNTGDSVVDNLLFNPVNNLRRIDLLGQATFTGSDKLTNHMTELVLTGRADTLNFYPFWVRKVAIFGNLFGNERNESRIPH